MKEEWKKPQINRLGQRAILISWKEDINEKLLYFILQLKNKLINILPKPKLDIINTYNSLLIKYDFTISNFYTTKKRLKSIVESLDPDPKSTTRLFRIPVCYNQEFGWDLKEVSIQNDLSKNEIIDRHTTSIYTVYFIGFLPGFLYLGGLDDRLRISRKKEPRKAIQKGAVGLAENQTGIYPQKSAGGWHIIGNCPAPIFTASQNPPSLFVPGDKLKFEPISSEKYKNIAAKVETGQYELHIESYQL